LPARGDHRRISVGLLGGSFNPAHAGHRHVAEQVRRHLRLDQVWLLVSPGNPLKPVAGMAPHAARLRGARAIADGRRVLATGIEASWGHRFTVDTLRSLRRHFPTVRFVLIMGADLMQELPRWHRWQQLMRHIPVVVMPRPGYTRRALASIAAHRLAKFRLPASRAPVLSRQKAPAWIFLPVAQHSGSATAIRRARPDDAPKGDVT
jgi:nicotinate-nucleotide adenylyltransferase